MPQPTEIIDKPKDGEAPNTGKQLYARGQSGNPMGKPRGARSLLSQSYLSAMHTDFVDHGAQVIEKVRENDPSTYLRIIASLMPRNVKLDVNTTDTVDLLRAMNEFRLAQSAILPPTGDQDLDIVEHTMNEADVVDE